MTNLNISESDLTHAQRLGAIDATIFAAIVVHGIDPNEMREQVEAAIVSAEEECEARGRG
jgi:hypothetical protein